MSELTPMFVLVSEYRRPIKEVEEVLPRHSTWVTEAYESGRVLVSGRREPPIGGLIVAVGADREDVEEWLASDPFVVAGVATYVVDEFGATDFPKRSQAFDRFLKGGDGG